jgi:type VI secretion system VasD/TssJ family lipoprotein
MIAADQPKATRLGHGLSRRVPVRPRGAWQEGARVAALVALAPFVAALACARPAQPHDVCFEVRASQNLNTYGGQPHVVVVDLHPLETSGGFDQLSAGDLINGAKPSGQTGTPIQMTIAPGEQREVRETFPANTKWIGVVADYYRAPGAADGTRKLVAPASCGRRGSTVVVLSPSDLLLEK